MKTEYIKLLCLLTEFRGSGIIPEKYAREFDQQIDFLKNEIENTNGFDKSKTITGLSKLLLFLYNLFKPK
jgi:hypothetical protein